MKNKLVYMGIFFGIAAVIMASIFGLKDDPRISKLYAESRLSYYVYAASLAVRGSGDPLEYTKKGGYETIPVLLYHGIVDKDDGFNVTRGQFEEQMEALKTAGYETLTLEEFKKYVREKKRPENKVFLLTFDDGRKDSYYGADPVLQALDYKATMFIITGKSLGEHSFKSTFYLDPREIDQMQKTGRWEIHSHGEKAHEFYPIDEKGTKGHFYVNKLWIPEKKRTENETEFEKRVHGDFLRAKNDLIDRFGPGPTMSLAFPFGEFGESSMNFPGSKNIVMRVVADLYDFSFFQYHPRPDDSFRANYIVEGGQDAHFIKRISSSPKWTGQDIVHVLDAAEAVNIPYVENFQNTHRWIEVSGDRFLDVPGSVLILNTRNGLAFSYLDGAKYWQDYTFDINLSGFLPDDAISLVARFINPLNYAECLFANDKVYIRKMEEGNLILLASGGMPFSISNSGYVSFQTRVAGDSVSCGADGQDLLSFDGTGMSGKGGVGIKIWNAGGKESNKIIIDKIVVEN